MSSTSTPPSIKRVDLLLVRRGERRRTRSSGSRGPRPAARSTASRWSVRPRRRRTAGGRRGPCASSAASRATRAAATFMLVDDVVRRRSRPARCGCSRTCWSRRCRHRRAGSRRWMSRMASGCVSTSRSLLPRRSCDVVLEPIGAEVVLLQAERLDHGAHRAVEHEDALAGELRRSDDRRTGGCGRRSCDAFQRGGERCCVTGSFVGLRSDRSSRSMPSQTVTVSPSVPVGGARSRMLEQWRPARLRASG